ncbi:hypothetical protein ACP70R_021251 [Stipagrostis hirtigluma subsp. patula]
MPRTGSAAGNGLASRSAIVCFPVTGHHELDIEGYSHAKELPTGKCIWSQRFTFNEGGPSWHIKYYPNGVDSRSSEFISVYLYTSSAAGAAKARAKFSLLDRAGQPVPSHSLTAEVHDRHGLGIPQFIRRAWLEESEHLVDDRFTIRCDLLASNEFRAEDRAAAPPFVEVPPSDMNLHLGDLLETGKGADVTFQVGGETFRAHRCVLAARSAVFDAELFGPMKEGTDTAIIHVDDMEPEVFRALLSFVYTDELPDRRRLTKQKEAAMAQHLLVAADRYDLQRLKLICEDKLLKHINKASCVTIMALAEQHHCLGLKKACFNFLRSPSTLNAVMATEGFEHLTTSCPYIMKEIMSSIAAANMPDGCEETS